MIIFVQPFLLLQKVIYTSFHAVVTADLFRRNFHASGFVPIFEEFSGFVPGVLLRSKTQFGDGNVVRNRLEAQ